MDLLSLKQLTGNVIELKTSDPRHIHGRSSCIKPSDSPEENFGKLFTRALSQVNDLQHKSMNLTQAMITDPDSVDIHDVTIAIAEATLSLSMTKSIMDGAIRAYREIINTR